MPAHSKDLVSNTIRILGIETSCDETAAAVIENGRDILSNVIASQADLHARYGGVFPEVASRQHVLSIYPIVEQALQQAHLTLEDIDAIAVTRGPGLPGSLVVGINAAKGLALGSGSKPLLGINHLEGHLYAAWLSGGEIPARPIPSFPLLALIVSGGHTELILMSDHLTYQRLGATRDDAAGEAFDKVARLLGLGYPGGPAIQNAAEDGNPLAFDFPRAWLEDSWDFSFSGLKTAVLRSVESQRLKIPTGMQVESPALSGLHPKTVADMAASFQTAVVDVLVSKTMQAVKKFNAQSLVIAGGVSANKNLRQSFEMRATMPLYIPPLSLCTDNAAMIAAAGHYRFIHGQRDSLDLDAMPNWPLTEVVHP
jgi:N6-L-threonylcarbamoyladenine synthase